MRLEQHKNSNHIGPYRPSQEFLSLSEQQWKPSDLNFEKIIQATEGRINWRWAREDLGGLFRRLIKWSRMMVILPMMMVVERMLKRIYPHGSGSSPSSPTKQPNLHRAGFVITHRYPSTSPEGLGMVCSHLDSFKQSIVQKHLSQDQRFPLEHLSLESKENPRALFPVQSPPVPCFGGGLSFTPCDYRFVSWHLGISKRAQRSPSPSTVDKSFFYILENISDKS